VRVWAGIIWPRIGGRGRFLWMRYWPFRLQTRRDTSWSAERLLACQVGHCSRELGGWVEAVKSKMQCGCWDRPRHPVTIPLLMRSGVTIPGAFPSLHAKVRATPGVELLPAMKVTTPKGLLRILY
jgi:hypothetical protein